MTAELLAPMKLWTSRYKTCRHCGGTLRLEREVDSLLDHDACDYVCLQCGRHTPLATILAKQEAATGGRAA